MPKREYSAAQMERRRELIRGYRARDPERYREQTRIGVAKHRLLEENKVKNRARVMVRDRGVPKKPCEADGCTIEKAEAHHEDYSKPLDVIWLCKLHHEEHHHKQSKDPQS